MLINQGKQNFSIDRIRFLTASVSTSSIININCFSFYFVWISQQQVPNNHPTARALFSKLDSLNAWCT